MTVQEILTTYDIPNYTLAELAGCSPQDVSTYLRAGYMSGKRRVQIERAAADLKMIFERLQLMGDHTGVYLTVRAKDVNSIRKFIAWCNEHPDPQASQQEDNRDESSM